MRSKPDMNVLRQVCVILIVIATMACPAECQNISYPALECFYTSLCLCCSVPCPLDGSGQCGGNCKDGYHGGKCYNMCPRNCFSCVDAQQGGGVANCTLCRDGYFSTASLYQCQSACSSNCKTCVSNTTCTSCQDGYYLSEFHQCVKCNEACVTCSSSSSCTSCRVGFYLDTVHEQCNHCNPICSSCNTSDTCICSNGCDYEDISRLCQGETSLCYIGCRMNFTSKYNTDERDRCDQCIDGNHGIDCDLQCKANCDSAQCERISGNCLRCSAGFYGDKCELYCPTNCQSSCDKTTGLCDSCKRGFYGNNCTLDCPTHCQICTYTNGQCTACDEGFYGENCEVNCPENCLERTCNQTNGHCFSCVPRFMGPRCEISIITSSSTNGLGPPLVLPATPQKNFVGAAVGITLAAVVIISALVGAGLWCYRKGRVLSSRNRGISSGNRSLFSITLNMSHIEKVEKEMASIDSQLIKLNTQSNKLTSRRSELEAKLETLRSNIPYQNTNRADNVEDKSYEMLQREINESQYSTLQ